MIKLSIIIPVYNVEDYLDDCLSSVFNQDLPLSDYEVIIINDGTKDNSESIILKYQNQFTNIVYIKQENQGVSVARNKGLDVAKGTYITFIDADDVIHANTLKTIVERLEHDNLDILYLCLDVYNGNNKLIKNTNKVGEDFLVLDGLTHGRRTYTPIVYTKDIIGNTKFLNNIIIGEDTVFNAVVQSKALRCSYLSIPYYKYFVRSFSATKRIKTKEAFHGFILAIEHLIRFRNTNFSPLTEAQKNYFDEVITVFCSRIIEFNILPNLNRKHFNKLKSLLKDNKMDYLNAKLAIDFPYYNSDFPLFYAFQKSIRIKQAIKSFLNRIKPKTASK